MIWLWWLAAAIALGAIETLVADLTFLMLSGGALGAVLVALLGAPLPLQALVFVIVSALLLLVVRPWVRGRLAATSPGVRTNAEALIGLEAVTLTEVTTSGGRVRLAGGDWSARLATTGPADAPTPLPEGTAIRVTAIDGAVAVVVPLPRP